MRIDKLLEEEGIGSRNQVKTLIKSQQVKVNEQVITDGKTNVDPSLQVITASGTPIQAEGHHYFILNKPNGVVSARSDGLHQTVIDCLSVEDRYAKLYPIGRLDRDTEGLVLLTDNGPLGFRMLHPKHHVSKTYLVRVNGQLKDDALVFFEEGIVFHDGTKCKPAHLQILKKDEKCSEAVVTISEGKFHQVKKMFLAYGLKVIYLKRISFAGLTLGELPVGQYRKLTKLEKTEIIKFLD
ncbi:Ribosomal large subunit pseudouridine synthase B [Streptococcus parauberis]|uniref:Pseudouridine synthase n=1 Tax=Streptococcus parauberis TaxID=1348 RepID=A0A854WRE2_9STRE|nr:pseudouridine synthase [Streptococcus parauberis]PCH12684.1 Ribosomal large subunit pseudouridine synthase B [Streptococcus parauberis]